jgi:hypothetical protein
MFQIIQVNLAIQALAAMLIIAFAAVDAISSRR